MNKESGISTCSNCGKAMPKDALLCPYCGQTNKEKKIKLFDLIRDFFSNFIIFDFKIFNTLKALLIPGKITRDFFSGKHGRFTSPWRLFFISIVAMLILISINTKIEKDYFFNNKNGGIYINFKSGVKDGLSDIDSTKQEYRDSIMNIVGRIDQKSKLDSVLKIFYQDSVLSKRIVKKIKKQWEVEHILNLNSIKNKIPDSDYANLQKVFYTLDTEIVLKDSMVSEIIDSTKFTLKNQLKDAYLDSFDILGAKVSKYDAKTLSLSQIKTRYKIKDAGFWKNTTENISYKFKSEKLTFDILIDYILKNINWYIIFLLPIAALIFKLLYIRRKRYFVEHLVFNLHGHSAIMLMFSLYIIISWIHNTQVQYSLDILIVLSPMLYYIIAMKKYYRQSWIKTTSKFLLFSFVYLISIIITTVIYVGIAAAVI